MIKEVTATGKDLEAALANAKAALGASPLDDVKYDILELGSKGIFGIIGVKPTKIKAYIEIPDAEPVKRPRRGEIRIDESEIMAAIEEERRKAPKKSEPETPADTEEVISEKIEAKEGDDMSFDLVCKLIANLGIDASAELYTCSDGSRRIVISGKDASMLIGHHGETLDSLQYLANLACVKRNSKGERDRSRVTIDIEGYRMKREEALRALARKMAAKAIRNHRSVVLEPMNAYERRIIHSELHDFEGVSTNSIGQENNRKVVIYLTDKKEPEKQESND